MSSYCDRSSLRFLLKVVVVCVCLFGALIGGSLNESLAIDSSTSQITPLSMERIFASGEFGERGVFAVWASSGSAFIKRLPSKEVPYSQDIVLEEPTGEQSVLVSAQELIPQKESGEKAERAIPVDSFTVSNDSNIVLIYSNSKRVWRMNTKGDYWILDRKNKVFRKLGGNFATPSSLQFAKTSPDGTRVAYVYKNNIFVEEIVSGKIVQLTFDGNADIINGTFDWVYEEEFDCRDGFRWSPDSNQIAFWRLDSSHEPQFVMLDDVDLSTVTGATRIESTQINGDFQTSYNDGQDEKEDSSESSSNLDATERLKSYPKLVTFKYPRVGCANAAASIGIVTLPGSSEGANEYDPAAATKFVDFQDTEEFYLPGMEWYEGKGGLIVQKTPRSQRECLTYSIDPFTCVPTLLFSESDPDGAWQTVYSIYPLGDGDRFLRVSERDGWRRYYLSSFSDLEQLVPVSVNNADVIDFVSLDYDHNGEVIGVYYYASPDNSTQRFLYHSTLSGESARVDIVRQDSDSEFDDNIWGFETWSISADSSWAIVRRSAFGVPTRIDLVKLEDNTANIVKCLENNTELRKKLAREEFGASRFIKVEIDPKFDFESEDAESSARKESVVIDGWVMLPRDWSPNDSKQYPVLVYVYGEPASQTVLDSWGGSTYLYHRAIAESGCVVVSFDGRGTPAPKGRKWRKSVYQKFGAVGRNDQAAALKQFFATFPNAEKLDKTRVGVWGWSGGGTSTLNLLFNYPDLYTCGISVAPVPDYRNYDTIYQERYSGLISETPESYALGSPIGYAKNLQGKLLLVHGSGDDNCHFQTSERLINALVSSGKEFDMFVYPFRSHGIFEGQGTTLHLRKKMMKFWERNLFDVSNSK